MKFANLWRLLLFWGLIAAGCARAQEVDVRDVSLVLQISSDCVNSDVSAADASLIFGTASTQRRPDRSTVVFLELTARPNTAYHVFLKCVRLLGDLTTGADGRGSAAFRFQTNEAEDVFGFELYPEAALLGNRFQSVQVNFRLPPITGSPRVQYLSQVGNRVNFAYADMPSGTEIAAFNSTTGFMAASPPHLLNQGGSGTAAIVIGASGLFHLVARNQASQYYIAQTIDFYIN